MTNYTKREQEAYDYGYHKRNAEVEALKARVEELRAALRACKVYADESRTAVETILESADKALYPTNLESSDE